MNESPWSILGLERSGATEKDVKRAYARLLREHRPDTDPDGFQRVRQAYEAALGWLKRAAAEEAEDEDASDGAPVPADAPVPGSMGLVPFGAPRVTPGPGETEDAGAGPPPEPGPVDPLDAAQLEVAAALGTGDPVRLRAALDYFSQLCSGSPRTMSRWSTALPRIFTGRLDHLADSVPDEQFVRELGAGFNNVTLAALSQWEDKQLIGRMCQFARFLRRPDHQTLLNNPAAAFALARLGFAIGFYDPQLAHFLANSAYPLLDTHMREAAMNDLDRQMGLGKIFSRMSVDQKIFWHVRLNSGDKTWDWSDDASCQARSALVQSQPHDWPGWSVVHDIVPTPWWEDLKNQLAGRKRTQPGSEASAPASSSRSWPRWLLPAMAFLLIHLGWQCSETDRRRARAAKPEPLEQLPVLPLPKPPPLPGQPEPKFLPPGYPLERPAPDKPERTLRPAGAQD